jgi:pyruvate formate lyase activating enzyme
MRLGGLQKTSLIDYPEKISAIVWTVGCNFRCPFCYNKEVVIGNVELIPEQEIFSFLKKRKNMLEGLVITGGEPLLQDDIENFCERVKKLDYLIKIDTNGTFPDKLHKIIDNGLVDYIAIDVKAPLNKYEKLTNVKVDVEKIMRSIELVKTSSVDHEFRTTFVPGLLKMQDIIEIADLLKGAKKFYLQQFKPISPMLSKDLECVEPYDKDYLFETLEKIKPYFEICDVRGL